MTPADEAHFIELWQQGLTHEAMARQLGCPVGTVKSPLHALQRQGKMGFFAQPPKKVYFRDTPLERPCKPFPRCLMFQNLNDYLRIE